MGARPRRTGRARPHAAVRNPSFESAARLNALASATFNQGSAARDTAERYVRDTVLFASVLFLFLFPGRDRAALQGALGAHRDDHGRLRPGCLHHGRGADPCHASEPPADPSCSHPSDFLADEGRRILFTFVGVGIAVIVMFLADRLQKHAANPAPQAPAHPARAT